MEKIEINEGNKLINDFLSSGIEPIPSGMHNEIISGDYHRDMDILSLVCNKIKKFFRSRDSKKEYAGCCHLSIDLEFNGRRHKCESRLYGSVEFYEEGKWKEIMTPHIHNEGDSPCFTLWLTVIEFIKWYNSLSK